MIPGEVRQRLRKKFGIGPIESLPPGMSGARVFRCHGDPPLVLRRWPLGTTTARVREVHRCWNTIAHRCPIVPKLKPIALDNETFVLDASGGIWELMTWVPGQPLEEHASIDGIRAGAAAIGQIHERLKALGMWSRPAPAVADRLGRLSQLRQTLPRCFAAEVRRCVPAEVSDAVFQAQLVLNSEWSTVSNRLVHQLSPWSDKPVQVQYVVRDVHREHILFARGMVRGLIDFDALRIDTPATDLARWATGFEAFRRDRGRVVDEILADYVQHRSFPLASGDREVSSPWGSEFRTLILAVAEASVWISLANWVVWLVEESRQFPDFQLVSERIGRLTESVRRIEFR